MTRSHRARRLLAGTAASALLCLPVTVLAAPSAGASPPVPAAAVSLPAASRLPAPPTVTVSVGDRGVRLPATLRAGRHRFVVRTKGDAVLQLAKASRGYGKAQFLRDLAADSERSWRRIQSQLRFYGGAEALEGQDGVFTETLHAGEYWVFDWVSGPESVRDVRSLRVSGSPRATAYPRIAGAIRLAERGVSAPAALPRRGTVLVRNPGGEDRALALVQLAPGRKLSDLRAWLRDGKGEPPLGDGYASTALLSGGLQFAWSYDLPPGSYALLDLLAGAAARGVTLR